MNNINKVVLVFSIAIVFFGYKKIDANEDTINWSIYKNPAYRYEIKYPEGWHYEKETDFTGKDNAVNFYPPGKKRTVEYSGDITIFYYRNPKGLSIDAFFNGSQGTCNYFLNEGGEKEYLLNDIKAKMFFKIKAGFESKPANLVIPVKDKFFIISDVYTKYQDDLFFKMVSTFKLFEKEK
ncbi:MAG: hypothetical protein HS132_03110 [Planctomycetia bacterium]|nr:hypothetical protein [Planctomycetia bacterium]